MKELSSANWPLLAYKFEPLYPVPYYIPFLYGIGSRALVTLRDFNESQTSSSDNKSLHSYGAS